MASQMEYACPGTPIPYLRFSHPTSISYTPCTFHCTRVSQDIVWESTLRKQYQVLLGYFNSQFQHWSRSFLLGQLSFCLLIIKAVFEKTVQEGQLGTIRHQEKKNVDYDLERQHPPCKITDLLWQRKMFFFFFNFIFSILSMCFNL